MKDVVYFDKILLRSLVDIRTTQLDFLEPGELTLSDVDRVGRPRGRSAPHRPRQMEEVAHG